MLRTRLGAVALVFLLLSDFAFTKVEGVDPVGIAVSVASASAAVNSVYFGLRNVAMVISRLSTLRGSDVRNHKILTARDMEYLNLLQLRNGIIADKDRCEKSFKEKMSESRLKAVERKYTSLTEDLDKLIAGRVSGFQRLVSPVPVWALVEASLLVCMTTLGETKVLVKKCERSPRCNKLLAVIGKTGSKGDGFTLEKAKIQFDEIVHYWEHNLEKQAETMSGKLKTKLWDLRAKLRGIEGGTWREKSIFEQARAILISNDKAFPKNMHIHIERLRSMLGNIASELREFLRNDSHPMAMNLEDADDANEVILAAESPSAVTLRPEDNVEPLETDHGRSMDAERNIPDSGVIDDSPIDLFGDDDDVVEAPLIGSLGLLETGESVRNSDLTELASAGSTIFTSLYGIFNDFKRLVGSDKDYYGMLSSIKTVSNYIMNLESLWSSLIMCTDFVSSTFGYLESDQEEERDAAEMRLKALKNMSYYLKITRNRIKNLQNKIVARFSSEQEGIWDMNDTVGMFVNLLGSWQSMSNTDRGCAILYTGVGESYLESIQEKDHTKVCPRVSDDADVRIEDASVRDRDIANLADRYNNFLQSQFTIDVVSMYQPVNQYRPLPDKYIRLDKFGDRSKRKNCIPEEEFATMCERPGFIMSVRYQPELVGDEGELAPTSFYFRVPMIQSREEMYQPYDDEGITNHICNMLKWRTGHDSVEARACSGDDRYEWVTESIFKKGRREYYTNATRGSTIKTKSAWYHARAHSFSRENVVSDDERALKYLYVSDFEDDRKTLAEPDTTVFFLRARIVEKESTSIPIEVEYLE